MGRVCVDNSISERTAYTGYYKVPILTEDDKLNYPPTVTSTNMFKNSNVRQPKPQIHKILWTLVNQMAETENGCFG